MPLGSRNDFARALSEAVRKSHMTHLDIIRGLRSRGDTLSQANFDAWRTGRSYPERAATIASVVTLEQVLGVSPGSLVSTLPGRRRYAPNRPMTWQDGDVLHALMRDAVDRMREELGLPWDDGLRRVSAYHVITVRPDRTQGRNSVREGLVAQRGGITSFMKFYAVDDPQARPYVAAVAGCHLGRVLEETGSGAVVLAEILFDRALAEGESARVEFEFGAVGVTQPDAGVERAVSGHLTELTQTVRFEGEPPASVVAVDVIDDRQRRRALALEEDGSVIEQRRDLGTGRYGVWWSWDADLRDPNVPLPY